MSFLSILTHAIILLLSTSEEPLTIRPPSCQLQQQARLTRPRPYTVLLEGNVGAGKSTFVDILTRDDIRISPVPEPVQVWQNFSGTGVNLLDRMLNDGHRWSGAFQLVSTLSRYL